MVCDFAISLEVLGRISRHYAEAAPVNVKGELIGMDGAVLDAAARVCGDEVSSWAYPDTVEVTGCIPLQSRKEFVAQFLASRDTAVFLSTRELHEKYLLEFERYRLKQRELIRGVEGDCQTLGWYESGSELFPAFDIETAERLFDIHQQVISAAGAIDPSTKNEPVGKCRCLIIYLNTELLNLRDPSAFKAYALSSDFLQLRNRIASEPVSSAQAASIQGNIRKLRSVFVEVPLHVVTSLGTRLAITEAAVLRQALTFFDKVIVDSDRDENDLGLAGATVSSRTTVEVSKQLQMMWNVLDNVINDNDRLVQLGHNLVSGVSSQPGQKGAGGVSGSQQRLGKSRSSMAQQQMSMPSSMSRRRQSSSDAKTRQHWATSSGTSIPFHYYSSGDISGDYGILTTATTGTVHKRTPPLQEGANPNVTAAITAQLNSVIAARRLL